MTTLTEDGHAGQVYELTGPRLLTFSEAVGEIAKVSGRKCRYVQISHEAFVPGLAKNGVPADDVALLKYLFTTVLDGRSARVTHGVQRALAASPGTSANTDRAQPPPAFGTRSTARAGHA